jgi:UDP-glucuronate 4-epimerase
MHKRKKVFITGISGMIGFHTAKALCKLDWDVTGLDNFNNFYDVQLKRDRAKILKEEFGISVIDKDILDIDLNEISQLKECDVLLHLAAYVAPRHSLDFPENYIETNISGTSNLLKTIEKYNIPTVYASTSCVMHGQKLPWKESDLPSHQNNPYGWSKRVNECQFMHSKIERSIGLRFFTAYGPYGRPDMAIFKFTKNILSGEPVDLYNKGEMFRDFTFVEDIVQGVEIILKKIVIDDARYHEIYNIGYGEKINLMDLLKEIEKNLGINAKTRMLPKHPADVPATWSDTQKIRKLGYYPKTNIKHGIREFIKWYKHYYKIN